MEHTMNTVAAVLSRHYQHTFTKRQLTDWIQKGLLPPLSERGKGRGRGKAYYWPQPDIVRQAATVYELLQWYGRVRALYLPLWLLGYEIPIEPVRRLLLEPIETALARLTGGKQARDDIEEQLSRYAYALGLRHQRSHRAPQKSTDLPAELLEQGIEIGLNILANRFYKLTNRGTKAFTKMLVEANQRNQEPGTPANRRDPDMEQEFALLMQKGMKIIHEAFSLERIRQAVIEAKQADLHQSQSDFQVVVLDLVWTLVKLPLDSLSKQETLQYNILFNLGRFAIPLLLAARRAGYNEQIDKVVEWAEKLNQVWRTDHQLQRAWTENNWPLLQAKLPEALKSMGISTSDDRVGEGSKESKSYQML